MLPLLGINGILTAKVIQDSFNAERFLNWITDEALPCMNPYPLPYSVLVMDNAPIHQVSQIRELCETRGVKLVMLPPYSPDFNPIEPVFGHIKAYMKRHHAFTSTADIPRVLEDSWKRAVTPDVVRGFYKHSGYVYKDRAHEEEAESNWKKLEEHHINLLHLTEESV